MNTIVIYKIGVDLDTKKLKIRDSVEKRMKMQGTIVFKEPSNHGWHYKIELFKPRKVYSMKSWLKVMELRHFCGDDPQRICFDMFKLNHGFTIIDILFDKKWSGW